MPPEPASRQLVVLAPPGFDLLHGGLWPGASVVHHPLPVPTRRSADVYRVAERLAAGDLGRPDGVLVVAPRNRSPRTAAPTAVVRETVVALVQADRPEDLDHWLRARTPSGPDPSTAAVCAMGKRIFLQIGESWLDALGGRGWAVDDWRARRLSRSELCQRLAGGGGVLVYAGHGRSRGWSGYQALRWPHLAEVQAKKPWALVLALACDTLTRSRGVVAFGSRWVSSGRAVAYAGWAGSLQIGPGRAIAERMSGALAEGGATTVADLLRSVVQQTETAAERRELRYLRVVGDPLASLWSPERDTYLAAAPRERSLLHVGRDGVRA